jgi:hypothetical protein
MPFSSSLAAEIVVNGAVQPIALAADTRHKNYYRGRLQLDLKSSSWFAVRWLSPDARNCSIAHTAPIYFWKGQQPIPIRRAEAEYPRARRTTDPRGPNRAV